MKKFDNLTIIGSAAVIIIVMALTVDTSYLWSVPPDDGKVATHFNHIIRPVPAD